MKRRSVSIVIITSIVFLICIGANTVSAADTDGFTRADFDQIMRWVNLSILVALIVKYARRPFLVFLSGKKKEVAQLIARYEGEKREAEAKISEAQTLLSASQERLALIKEKVIEEGRRRQAEIIEDAQKEGQLMIDAARLKIKTQIREAFGQIKAELVDAASHEALEKIPERITAEDHAAFVQQWLESVEQWEKRATRA